MFAALLLRRVIFACLYNAIVLVSAMHRSFICCDTKVVRTCSNKSDKVKIKIGCLFLYKPLNDSSMHLIDTELILECHLFAIIKHNLPIYHI